MALTCRFVRPCLRSLTRASALVALLAIPALAPAAGAQAEVDIGINEDGDRAYPGFDIALVVDFSSAVSVDGWTPYTLTIMGNLSECLEGGVPAQHPVNPTLSCLPDRLAAPR